MSIVLDGSNGILLPTAGSEYLNNYKEGTWTPIITDSDGHSCTMGTTANFGYYIKIGKLVSIFATIEWTSKAALTAPASRIRISGLPYTCVNYNNFRAACNFGSSSSGSFTIEKEEIAFGIDFENDFAWGTYISGTNLDGPMLPSHIGNSGVMYGFSVSYLTD